jgi:hypothetical protein
VIIGISTSSPWASVALIADHGYEVIAASSEFAPMQSSASCMRQLRRLLEETGSTMRDATLIATDLGPGSFTGTKVSVTIAKCMAFALGIPVVGAMSFDLIDPNRTVVQPSKRGEFFVREPGMEPMRSETLPGGDFVGFGLGITDQVFPDAVRFAELLPTLVPIDPSLLVPAYLIEPSISIPKSPLSAPGGAIG